MNSNIVSTQRPPIEIRTSSAICPTSDAFLGSSSASAIGVANGSARRAPIVASQKSPAKVEETTRLRSSSSA